MGEAAKFLRYALPGLVFLIVVGTGLYCTNSDDLKIIFDSPSNTAVSLVAVAFGSGGVGFILSVFYHVIFTILMKLNLWGLDHRTAIGSLLDSKMLFVYSTVYKRTSMRDAYMLTNIIWHLYERKIDTDKDIFFSNLINAVGTSMIAMTAAIMVYIFYPDVTLFSSPKSTWVIIIMGVVLVTTIINFILTKNSYQTWLNSTILSLIRDDFRKNGGRFPIEVNYSR